MLGQNWTFVGTAPPSTVAVALPKRGSDTLWPGRVNPLVFGVASAGVAEDTAEDDELPSDEISLDGVVSAETEELSLEEGSDVDREFATDKVSEERPEVVELINTEELLRLVKMTD